MDALIKLGDHMGKQWKAAGKTAKADKKGRIFTKLAREIAVAAKMGGPDPDANARLSLAISAARSQSCPKDTIERAIKRGAGLTGEDINYEDTVYEGYGPHQVAVIVECQTDNKNRTFSDIRTIFAKKKGNLGASGSVAWMFDRVSYFEAEKAEVEDAEEDAIEVGANEVEHSEGSSYDFYGEPNDLGAIREALVARGWDVKTAELSYKPKNFTELNEEQLSEVHEFLAALDDNDDTARISASIK